MSRIGKNVHLPRALAYLIFPVLAFLLPVETVLAAACPNQNDVSITHQPQSYCELCGVGEVTLRVVYSGNNNPDITNLTITEDFLGSGLEPIPGTTAYSVKNGTPPSSPANPTQSGTQWTWDLGGYLLTPSGQNPNNSQYLDITFQVRRSNSVDEEGLYFDSTAVQASFSYTTDTDTCPVETDSHTLSLNAPNPAITKLGRNVDANQIAYSNPVYGHNNDDVIWQIQIDNTGLADMQDLKFSDLMQNGNFQINYACPSEGEALSIANANGTGPVGNCVVASNTLNNWEVIDPFGNPGTTNYPNGGSGNGFTRNLNGWEVDVVAGGTTFIYLVGKVLADGSCASGGRNNTADQLEFGCEVDANGVGGIPSGTNGAATLNTYYGDQSAELTVTRDITGINPAQPVGSRGYVTLTISNNTGGSVKDIVLTDVLPPQYVVDPTYWTSGTGLTKNLPVRVTPVVGESSINPLYGSYPGMIDRLTWENPTGSLTSPSQDPLQDTAPRFRLLSSTTHPDYADQVNMLRHGDVLTVTFPIVLISQDRNLDEPYDLAANLDVSPEITGDGTDPAYTANLNNSLTVDYDTFCNTQGHQQLTFNDTFAASPEDLDIAIGGTVFILTNDPTQQLTLPVQVTNNGGHDASDYHVFVTFGATMDVVGAPAGCSLVKSPSATPSSPDEWQPSPRQVWVKDQANPIAIPSTATVYECISPAVISPGQLVTYNFNVIKTSDAGRIAVDDLTFRADVIGEVNLYDGTPLWFPSPVIRPDGLTDPANNYSLDAVWARVIGFNLKKNQSGTCSENNPPSFDGNGYEEVQIGEECTFHIETGGWFGFQTPGYAYIAVQNIDVVDEIPDGQAYISSTDPKSQSTPLIGINGDISLNPVDLTAPDERWFDWRFNVADANRIEVADEWFRVNVTTRLLNKPIDTRAAPNVHGADSFNVLNSTFDATFSNLNTGGIETYPLGPGAIGYPNEPIRRVDLRVTEPNILVTKQVCNETLYGSGTGCSNFVDLADDGDTQDSYIYKVTLTNETSSAGVTRAPAYNIVSTDVLDSSDMMYVVPFNSDGLDNDGDGLIDGADADGEGSISDNVVQNGTPATITYSHTHSSALLKIDAGGSVTFYYRVDPDDSVAPLQTLTNTVSASYDSMAGDSGNQTVAPGSNGTLAGARLYNSSTASAAVQILPLQTQPKTILQLSNTPLGGAPQPVSVGEEIEYELRAFIPVANLRTFVIRDELPPGLSCAEAPVVNLDAPPYNAAGFFPGGQITPVCNDNLVEWYFGDQELTAAPSSSLFEFPVSFIARVENTALTNNGLVISNGDPATNVTLSYINDAGSTVTLNYGQIDLVVREPQIALTKSFAVANSDAADVLTVTVTATNTGSAAAYNLQVLDDLVGTNLTYVGNLTGADPPDVVDTTTLGANRPIFKWNSTNPDYEIPVGQVRTFSFDVRVDTAAQPHEILNNSIQASWTSLPLQTTALNSSGSIGSNGSSNGMRIGVLPNNPADTINDYETVASAQTEVPPLTMSKTDLNPAQPQEVGGHRNFEIVIQLPEGTTNNLIVSDALDTAGVSYVLSNNADFDITYSFEGIASINGSAPAESAFIAFPADNTSGTAVWNIGQVVTDTEDDINGTPAINPVIRINYYARANNDLSTNAGTTLRNSATTTYTNGETAATENLNDTTTQVNVTESSLSVSKAVTPVTPAPITGGDVLEYAVTVVNNGNATAYDVNVVDTLPVELELDTGFTPTAAIDTVAVAGFVPTPAGAPSGPLVWGRDNGDGSLDIPAGSTLVLTYRVLVQANTQSNITLSNSVLIDWTSLDGVSSYERNGAGCPTITAPDDYCAGPAVASVSTTDTNSFTKSVVADSYAPVNDATLRIGDTVTYQLSLNLQEGTTRSVAVQDVLPAGLAFYDIVSINGDTTADYTPPVSGAGSNFSYAPVTAAALPTAGQTGTLTFTLGDVANDPLGDATTDSLLIVYRARVMEDTLAQQPSTTLNNTATLSYVDGSGIPVVDPARLQSTASITVLQPVMTTPTKTDAVFTSPASVNIATDTMQFQLESCNTTGLAPAYNVQLTDDLPPELNETSIVGPTVTINGAPATVDVDYTYTPPAVRGGTLVFNLITPVNPGQCVTVNYDIGFYTDIGPNQSWNNSVTVDEYWSLPSQSGQQYGPLGPTIFTMSNSATIEPPSKTMVSPASGEATIGEEVVYRISVPNVTANAALYDVVISDTLHPSLEYVSATDVSGNGLTLTDNTAGNNVSLNIAQIPAGQQAVIELRARVANNADANAGTTFGNTASYTYATSAGGATLDGGSDTTPTALSIVEPLLTINKAVANLSNPGNPPAAGDVLRYTVTFPASGGAGGDNFSDAFDLNIVDNLSLGLAYQTGTATVDGAGNTITDPTISGDGITTPQTLNWNLADTTADITVVEGTTVTVTYDVLVLDGVQANQDLTNSATVQWTSLDGVNSYERDGADCPTITAPDDYCAGPVTTTLTTTDNNNISKTRLTDTYGAGDANIRIGDIIEYELRLTLNEGTTSNVTVTDTLPQGLGFEQVVSINGDTTAPYSAVAPFGHADLAAPVVSGDPVTGPSTVTWNIGDIVNAADGNPANDEFVIVYRARVLDNALTQVATTTLSNTVQMDYTIASGAASRSASTSVTLQQPVLAVSKAATTAGGDTIIDAGELVTYTVDVVNNGAAPAYDLLLQDIIPLGMRNGAATVTMVSTTIGGTPVANPVPVYDAATGVVTWNLDTGTADVYSIPPGQTLTLVYQAQADADVGSGLTLSNQVVASSYYSFDDEAVPTLGGINGVREVYGPSNTATTTLTTPVPGALLKENPANTSVTIGETFSYRITVPAFPHPTALHDVRILDDLSASAADLSFVSVTKVSGSQPWTPVNTGTATNLEIRDTTNGIDIPAGEQVVIDITVVVNDSPTNVAGLTFKNTATYTYNRLNDTPATQSPGSGSTTTDMSIVEPLLTLQKSGPAQMIPTIPETFTLDVQNTGSSTAWDITITDILPNLDPAPGGMCDTPPANITVQVFESDGTTPVSGVLVAGTDYDSNFTGAPSCTLTITMKSAAAAVAPTQRLIVTYQAELDTDNPQATALTNVAGATEWFSLDTAGTGATGEIRTYSRTPLTDGTVGTLDHEDAHTVTTQLPVLVFQKTVENVTSGQNPATTAQPGDTLRYTVTITNNSPVNITDLTLLDELDRLNTTQPMFTAGTLNVVSAPAGADISNTDANGGTNGTGLLDVRSLGLDPQGGANDSLTVVYEVILAPAITSGSQVLNQAQATLFGSLTFNSDDPNINGVDDPAVLGDEDPTAVTINSAPAFEVWKNSQDLTGDPAVLEAGDTLRYTITVKNTGTEDAVNVTLRDQIPGNTSYVANSTTLNGVAVVDPAAGVSALESGMLINAPENTTAGYLRADSSATTTNVATITFDVVVSSGAVDGTVISNQGFVNGNGQGSGAFPEEPSDDPDTTLVDDPTIDVVGNVPLVDSQKTVAIVVDNGAAGIVDPGDTLRYTITTTNLGALPATGVVLTDAIPANTTYVPNSTTLNSIAVVDPSAGTSALESGMDISSADLTPPLPTAGNGTLSPGQAATVTFDVQVNGLVAVGTIISNQGTVSNNELPDEPTDWDGIDSNGDQPTTVVVGNVQQLAITKDVNVVGGGAAQAGGELEYVIRVTNISGVAATNVVITDNLDLPVAGQLNYVTGSATMNGSSAGISFTDPVLTADYATTYGDLQPGNTVVLRFRTQIDASQTIGTTITNTGEVSWDSGTRTASASVSIDVGGIPGSAILNGWVWHDADFDNAVGGSERLLQGWTVNLYRNGALFASIQTDANGLFQFNGIAPNDVSGDTYELRFVAPGAGANTASLGLTDSPFTDGQQRITGIVVSSGSNTQNLNLPIQPNGVVYDAVLRTPVANAQLVMLRASDNLQLPVGCFDDPAQQGQVTLANGYYKFGLNFSQPECAAGGDYIIQITPPASGYTAAPSVLVPPTTSASTAAFDVASCPGTASDAVPATANHCEAQTSEQPPSTSVSPGPGTTYYLKLTLNNGLVPGHSEIFNNHIPLDPELGSAVSLSKISAKVNVTRSDLVPYTITLNNTFDAPLAALDVIDTFPAGFKYVTGSSRVNDAALEPTLSGGQLIWPNLSMPANSTMKIKLLLIVGSGVNEGEYINRARVRNNITGGYVSGEARATVRVVADPTFDCSDIIGKVFDDKNLNGYQDEGEPGLASTRVATARGLVVTTDEYGRYHITCAITPNQDRGSNFIVKLDERSLPSGYRATTENPRVQRVTRGKIAKFNFGAAIHRVVRLDIANAVFEEGSSEMRPQWKPRLDLLIEQLKVSASVLRLSYLAENEDDDLVEDRLEVVKEMIEARWEGAYKLRIETEVFWRGGGPDERGDL